MKVAVLFLFVFATTLMSEENTYQAFNTVRVYSYGDSREFKTFDIEKQELEIDIKFYEYKEERLDSTGYLIVDYYSSDSLLMTSISNKILKNNIRKIEGEVIHYYPDGSIDTKQNYSIFSGKLFEWSKLDGESISYYSNGKVKKQVLYQEGDVIQMDCLDSTGYKIECGEQLDEIDYDFYELSKNFIFPKKYKDALVLVKVIFDYRGNPIKFLYNKNNDSEFIESVIKAVKMTKFNMPDDINQIPETSITIPIKFEIR
jgi:antitoxin component YwqK of YwqJK toxin-antitoxin module